MSIYLQKRKRDEYDRKSSIISVTAVLFLLISVSAFPFIFKPDKPGYYEKAEKNISAAVLKRVYKISEPVKTEPAVPKKKEDKSLEKKNPVEKKPSVEEPLDKEPEEVFNDKEEICQNAEDSSELAVSEEISSEQSSVNVKNIIIAELIELINKKKRYPSSARRRNITGTVEIIIHINSSSVISGFSIDAYDSSILKKSAEKVMRQLVDTKLSSGTADSFSVKIPVRYILK